MSLRLARISLYAKVASLKIAQEQPFLQVTSYIFNARISLYAKVASLKIAQEQPFLQVTSYIFNVIDRTDYLWLQVFIWFILKFETAFGELQLFCEY